MWLLKDSPALLTDLYELTMAQGYLAGQMTAEASFEVSIRHLPDDWGFFVMAGLAEMRDYLHEFRFAPDDLAFLGSTGLFGDEFLEYLGQLRPEVKLRAMPEGTVFFPGEPILEVTGPLPVAQLLESYTLNILGFSIIEATLAARVKLAAGPIPVVDFGLRRSQGPVASIRSARAAAIAGFAATSSVFAARALKFACAGTMAHSFVQVHDSQEQAFRDFSELYGENAILLVDTYDCLEGIKIAAKLARDLERQKGLRIRGIRIDSGDLVQLTNFARQYFRKENVEFLKIFVSGDLDEFKIAELLQAGARIDGIGIGTRFSVSRRAPAVEIVYKLSQYAGRSLFKSSPGKRTYPGRKSVSRITGASVSNKCRYEKDIVTPFDPGADDLLRPFEAAERIQTIKNRLTAELARLDESIKAISAPQQYPVEFRNFPDD